MWVEQIFWGDGENINSTQSNTRPKDMPLLKSEDGMKQILPSKLWISSGRKKTKTAIFDYRARCSVAWDYEGCTYYQRPFREVFAQDKWKTYWILKYQNWKTQKDEPAPPKSFINERAIRYADVLLMLAECYNQTDQQTKAVDLINQVRARVDMPGLNSGPSYLQATTKEQVFERIRHERAVELAGEGLSFSDMKRWGLLETLAGEVKGFTGQFYYNRVVQSRDYLWPIPNNEIQKNPSLKEDQNPGW